MGMILWKKFRLAPSTSRRMNHNVGVSVSSGDDVTSCGGVSSDGGVNSGGGVSGGDGFSIQYSQACKRELILKEEYLMVRRSLGRT